MKRFALIVVLSILIDLLLVGCQKHKPVTPPDINFNPNPKDLFEIAITMDKAPDSLRSFKGRAIYALLNDQECVPVDYTRSLGGSKPTFQKEVEIIFQRDKGNTFKAELVRDLLLNEDYYGKGPCRWFAAIIGADLEMTHDSGRLGIATGDIFKPGHVIEFYCLDINRISDAILRGCRGLRGMLSGKQPKEWYYKVAIEAVRK